MSDQYIVKHCAPTLAGLKTGSLFTVARESREAMDRELRELNGVLTRYGFRAVPLRYSEKRVLIYLYRPDSLARDLSHPAARELLRERGYRESGPGSCLRQLIRRLGRTDGFPHEIGLFLGYPPEDVRGFIQNPYEGYQCVGFWKVYGDRESAEQTFSRYRRCTQIYCREAERGRTLEALLMRSRHSA